MHPINEFGTKEQKEKYLPALASGELIGCFVRSYGCLFDAFLHSHVMVGPHRTQPRVGSIKHGDHRRGNRWRVYHQWEQDLDYKRSIRVRLREVYALGLTDYVQ